MDKLNPNAMEFSPSPATSPGLGETVNVNDFVSVSGPAYASPYSYPQTSPPGKFGKETFQLNDYNDVEIEAHTPFDFIDSHEEHDDEPVFMDPTLFGLPATASRPQGTENKVEKLSKEGAAENYARVWQSRHKRENDLWKLLSPHVQENIDIVRLIADFEIVDIEYESDHVTHYSDGRCDTSYRTEFNVNTIAEGQYGHTLLLKDNGKVIAYHCGAPYKYKPLFAKGCIGVYSVLNCFTVLKSNGQCFSWVDGQGEKHKRISEHIEKVWVCNDRFQAKRTDGKIIFLQFYR